MTDKEMNKNIDKKAVGKRIYTIRKNMGLSLEQFGILLQASRSNVSKWELGKVLPRRERLTDIAKLGKISVNELLYGNNEHDKEELAQRLMEIPTKERVELILEVLKETKTEEENEEKKQKKIAAIKKITAI